jgi:hypothetical protein
MTDNHSTTTPRTMRLERRGILYGVSVLTPEGWLVFDTPPEGFGKMSPEQWVLARLRAMKAPARTSTKPKPRRTKPVTRSHATRTRKCGTTRQPSPPPGGPLHLREILDFREAHSREAELREKSGGAKRDRTADLLNAIQALSQLSYSPIRTSAAWGRHRVYTNDPP